MQGFVAAIVITGGFAIMSLAFKKGYNRISAFACGLLVVIFGFYILPIERNDNEPEIYYRK